MEPQRPKRTRRFKLFAILGILLAVFIGGYLVLTSSWVMGKVVLARLGAAIGGKATAASVRLSSDGSLVLESPSIHASGLSGDEGEVFSARRVSAHLNLGSLLFGAGCLTSLELTRPVIRLSQSVDSGAFNIASLAPAATPSARPPSGPAATVDQSGPWPHPSDHHHKRGD